MSRRLREIFGSAVAQPCSSGFAAIVLALRAARVRSGDDVILPTFTMIAVPNAVRSVGAHPVLIDNAKGDYNPTIREIAAAATGRTKAVILTHTYGVPTPDMKSIAALCREREWYLIEDISEAAGISTETRDGNRQLLGTFGDFACASLYANKLIQGGDGGFVLARDVAHAYRLGSLVNHGFTRSFHFVHLEDAPNFKMCGLAAALACGNLDCIDEIMAHRTVLSHEYRNGLQSTPLNLMPQCGPDDTPWVFGVVCSSKSERQDIRLLLAKHGVETRNYFFPIHAQPAYRDLVVDNPTNFPQSDMLAKAGFYLPTYTALKQDDIRWICTIINAYFKKEPTDVGLCPKKVGFHHSIRVNSDTLQLETRIFDDSGELDEMTNYYHYTTAAASLRLKAERYLWKERWDRGQILLQDMRECIDECNENGFDTAQRVLQPFLDYIVSQQPEELGIEEPWLAVDVTEGDFKHCANIPTTTELEVLQLLCWLIRQIKGTPNILELGSLFGASTAVIATAAKQQSPHSKLVAVDSFIWQEWMDHFHFRVRRKSGESFLDLFHQNTAFVSEVIQAVQCVVGRDQLPTDIFTGKTFDLVFLDFTRDIDEMESAWQYVKPYLAKEHSIVVINSLTGNTVSFITKHGNELLPIAKPHGTKARAFRYVARRSEALLAKGDCSRRQLRFLAAPDWEHHQKRAFNVAIDTLRDHLHSADAKVDFVAAIGEFLCDYQYQIQRPWVGIIHGVPRDDQFYPPDLERLCSKRYRSIMKLCRGLFTLTDFQADYLRSHLEVRIPICTLRLPMIPPETVKSSKVIRCWQKTGFVDLLFIGSFARDFQLFFDVKVLSDVRKVLLTGDEVSKEWARKASNDISIVSRVNEDEYEKLLNRSIIFLALKYNGAANTIVVECLARSVPIVAPRIESCTEYLGIDYPLLYDQEQSDISTLLTPENVQNAIDYLLGLDKSEYSISRFCEKVQSSSVLLSLVPNDIDGKPLDIMTTFDVTVCVCSYRRTQNLRKILNYLLCEQSFNGRIQVVVWNNNEARERIVRRICEPYLRRNSESRSLELISATSNHYCIIRASMLHLMKSELLLICDDDVIPYQTFVQFFVGAHHQYPRDILGVRGHIFLPHQLNHADPQSEWTNYDNIRFIGDGNLEQFVHFLHADACLIPRDAVREFASVALPDSAFILVDDYWMSFVLSHHFHRKLRKLQCAEPKHFERAADSDEEGLALYTRPEVRDAKIRMYIHHMVHGWPDWSSSPCSRTPDPDSMAAVSEAKKKWWNSGPFIGYNVSCDLTREDAVDLIRLGATVVRIGAVGSREDSDYEFHGFLVDVQTQMSELRETLTMLAELGIGVILTLHSRVVSVELWGVLAAELATRANVIGYDIINEPHVAADLNLHHTEVSSMSVTELQQYFDNVKLYLEEIRRFDPSTPVVIEPTFWAKPCALNLLSSCVDSLLVSDPNIIVSIHYYEPQMLVSRKLNKGRYGFPGPVPLHDCKYSETVTWDEESIFQDMEAVSRWQQSRNVKVFVGEFGVCRETKGAPEYLKAVASACLSNGISCLVYSFRECTWDAMNYELGPTVASSIVNTRLEWSKNPLVSALLDIAGMTRNA